MRVISAQSPVFLINRETIQRNPHADVALDVTDLRAHLAAVERHGHASGLACADCGFEWPQAVAEEVEEADAVVKDANGNVLADGDAVVVRLEGTP